MKNSVKISLLLFVLTFFGDLSFGEIEENNPNTSSSIGVVEELSKVMPEAIVLESEIPGIYSISIGTSIGYISKDGKYILRGDIIEAS